MFQNKIILGSSSPRRKELIEALGVELEVRKKEVDEHFPAELSPYEVPEFLARLKAQPLIDSLRENEVLLTSDTVVIHKNEILHKPKHSEDAFSMLSQLSGNSHDVVTGVYLKNTEKEVSFSSQTKVTFKEFSKEEIEYYIKTYQPFDKAGSYGIQEWIGMIGVKEITGDFYNVMGLPLNKVWEKLNTNFR